MEGHLSIGCDIVRTSVLWVTATNRQRKWFLINIYLYFNKVFFLLFSQSFGLISGRCLKDSLHLWLFLGGLRDCLFSKTAWWLRKSQTQRFIMISKTCVGLFKQREQDNTRGKLLEFQNEWVRKFQMSLALLQEAARIYAFWVSQARFLQCFWSSIIIAGEWPTPGYTGVVYGQKNELMNRLGNLLS